MAPGAVGDAYFHAGYKRSSGRKHEANKPLRDVGLIREVELGEYEYALDEKVRAQFDDNPQITESDIEALIGEVEGVLYDRLDDIET